jgi:hypothetical protein
MAEQKQVPEWLDTELESFVKASEFEKVPSLILEENKVTEIEIDFSEKFQRWSRPDGTTKAIIPVVHEGIKKNWWLTVRNPIYKDIVKLGKEGQKKFKIMQTGNKANTRYVIVK